MTLATGAGLVQYQRAEPDDSLPDPELWPRLVVATDQEASNISALGFLERSMKLNMEKSWDFSHSNWRDLIGALKAADLWVTTVLCLVAYNAPCGPWADDMRWHQVQTAMRHLGQQGFSECPLFMGMLGSLMDEVRAEDPSAIDAENPEQSLWDHLFRECSWHLKGDKVVLNRFMGARRKAAVETSKWGRRGFAYAYTCLECDFFKGSKFRKLMVKNAECCDPGQSSTSQKKNEAIEKALRSACQNVAVIAALVFNSPDMCTRQKIFHIASEPIDSWHSLQSKSCRSTHGTRAFLVDQVGRGGFLQAMSEVLAILVDLPKLSKLGFTVLNTQYAAMPQVDRSLAILREGDFAQELGVFVVSLVACRLKRMAYLLRGWPSRCAAFLVDGNAADEYIAGFRKDWGAYQYFADNQHLVGVSAIVERSVFKLRSVLQLRLLLEKHDYSMTEPLRAWLTRANSKCAGSLVIEDGFKRIKD